MRRRTFLGLVVSIGLSGCSRGTDGPVTTPGDGASEPLPTQTPMGSPDTEATLSPTPEPTGSPTPVPTDTPTPEPTPAPDEASYGFNGSGGDVTDDFDTAGGLVMVDLTHDGSSNFVVYAVDEEGNVELLVNHIGSYDGRVALALPAANYVLDIDADGVWTAEVTQPRYSLAEIQALPFEAMGTHADFFGPFEFEGRTEITVHVINDRHAAVWLTNLKGERVDLLTNDVGPYEETTLITETGYGLVVVDSDSAEWEIAIGD